MWGNCIHHYEDWHKLNETSEYLSSKFIYQPNDGNNVLQLRNTENKLAVPLPRNEYFKGNLSHTGAVLGNSLPGHLRQASSLTNLKLQIRCHKYSRL